MSVIPEFHLVVPGSLDQRTGGYLYDARMVQERRKAGDLVTVHEVPGRFPDLDEVAERALDQTLRGIGTGEIVVLDGLAMGCAARVLANHAGRLRLLALVHHPLADEVGLPPESRDRYRALESEALSHVKGVIVTSPFTAKRLRAFGVSRKAVRAVVPGTAPAPLSPGPGSHAPPRLLCVATLIPRKGQWELVRALGGLSHRAWSCVLAGSPQRDPSYASRVRGEIASQGLEERVRVVGELDEEGLEDEWRQASLFVLPSHYEGYGMALAEALARGVPVLSTTGGAIPQTVPEGAGLLVPPGDVDALRSALDVLLDDGEARAALAGAARRAAAALPGWPDQAEAFAVAVRELAAA